MRAFFDTFITFLLAALAAAVSVIADAECLHCERGLIGNGPVKIVCPWCDGVEPLPVAAAEKPDCRKSVVRIVVADGPSTSRGSGVVVEHDGKPLVLTAWHVVRSSASKNVPVVHFQDGTSEKGRVVKSSDDWDLAAIECSRYGAVAVPLAATPKDGEPLAIAGFGPHPSTFRSLRGRLVGRGRPTDSHAMDFVEVSVEARQGDSGGPMFNEAGEVAGILWGADNGITVGTHSGRVAAFLGNSPKELDRSSCPDGRCPRR